MTGGPATQLDCEQYAMEHGFDAVDNRVRFAIDPTGVTAPYYNSSGSSMSVLTNRFGEIVHKEVFDKPSIITFHLDFELDKMFDELVAETD